MFYHDHAWGITRLNVYAGEAAGYMITDADGAEALRPDGTVADMRRSMPLVIQDRTFVPSAEQLAAQDPTWDADRWGGEGNLWYHHVYMPAQNPGDPSGMSAYGRWMYGPWFWPPATPCTGRSPTPTTTRTRRRTSRRPGHPCNLDDPTTWQYQTEPVLRAGLIPGTPNISVGMEQFNDTPIVNGTAYPTTTVDPKAYRLPHPQRGQRPVLQPSSGTSPTRATGDGARSRSSRPSWRRPRPTPIIFPTPDTSRAAPRPDWIQIGTEGGSCPRRPSSPAQATTWITDPTRFDVGNVDKHSLLLAPAERADVIVDFSQFAGQTLILYNDAPAAFPARVASYDYYTGAPDLARRRAERSCPATARTPGPSCRSRSPTRRRRRRST